VDYVGSLSMRGLYAIVDVGTLAVRGLDPLAFAEAVLSVGPAALQLRAKNTPPREMLALLRALAPMCRRVGVTLVANDRPDIAVLAGCSYVHVGQEDMPIDRVRRLAPDVGVGVSTHTLDQLDAALAARPAYVAFGPVFETQTKRNPEPVVGVTLLREAYARAVQARVPLVAIGGITRERARTLVGMADAVAVVADLLPALASSNKGLHSALDVMREVADRARAVHETFAPGATDAVARV
jgi:thiamine-phosphate pyrophosphorylase